MIPRKKIEELISKHSLLEKDLSSGNVDKKIFAEKSKEYADINEIIHNAKKYFSYEKNRTEIQKILDDKNQTRYEIGKFSYSLRDKILKGEDFFINTKYNQPFSDKYFFKNSYKLSGYIRRDFLWGVD